MAHLTVQQQCIYPKVSNCQFSLSHENWSFETNVIIVQQTTRNTDSWSKVQLLLQQLAGSILALVDRTNPFVSICDSSCRKCKCIASIANHLLVYWIWKGNKSFCECLWFFTCHFPQFTNWTNSLISLLCLKQIFSKSHSCIELGNDADPHKSNSNWNQMPSCTVSD